MATPHIRNIFNDLTKQLNSGNHCQVLLSVDVNLTSHMKGRMSLLITIFLVLINIYNTIQTNSPQVWGSYQILKEEGAVEEVPEGFPSILTFFYEMSPRIICLLPPNTHVHRVYFH